MEFLTCEKCGFNEVPYYIRTSIYDPVLCIGCRIKKAYSQETRLDNKPEKISETPEEYKQRVLNAIGNVNKNTPRESTSKSVTKQENKSTSKQEKRPRVMGRFSLSSSRYKVLRQL